MFQVWFQKTVLQSKNSRKTSVSNIDDDDDMCYNEIFQLLARSQQGVCQSVTHTVALPFTLKSILRQKKNYGNSNISPCKNIIFQKQKSSKRDQNPLKDTKIL